MTPSMEGALTDFLNLIGVLHTHTYTHMRIWVFFPTDYG